MSVEVKQAFNNLLARYQQVAVRGAEILEATVNNDNPLELIVDGTMGALPKELVRIPKEFSKLEFELKGLTVEIDGIKHDIDGSKATIDNSLKVGDQVYLMKNQGGQLFYVLGRK